MKMATKPVNGRPRLHDLSPLARRVERMAGQRGMKLPALADAAGLHPTFIYKLHDPRLSTLRRLADALGVTVGRLVR